MSTAVRAFREVQGRAAESDAEPERDAAASAELLKSRYARGQAANPRIVVSEQAFARCLARCATEGNAGNCDGLANLAIEDLYLACACAESARGAAAAFERQFGRAIRRGVSRVLSTADERQDAEQRVRHHLLVDFSNGAPRIAQYLGQGPLEKWVSVAAMRIAISFGRAETAERRLREKAIAEAAGVDPEALFMKGELRDAFEAAVKDSLGQLSGRERLVLNCIWSAA